MEPDPSVGPFGREHEGRDHDHPDQCGADEDRCGLQEIRKADVRTELTRPPALSGCSFLLPPLRAPGWATSSYSGKEGEAGCVEVLRSHRSWVFVRDSRQPRAAVLVLRSAAWLGFLHAVRRGEFDR